MAHIGYFQDEAYKINCRNLLQGADWALSARPFFGHVVKSFHNAQSAKCTARTTSEMKKKRYDLPWRILACPG